MIPVPLSAPQPTTDEVRGSGTLMAWLGGLLLFGAFIGAVSWYVVIAPTSFVIFDSTPGYARVDAAAGQTYVVAGEGAGVLDETRPPPLTISVHGVGGQQVAVVDQVEPPDELGGPTYDLLGRQGTVLAAFTPTVDGSYLVSIGERLVSGGEGYAPVPPAQYSVGRELGVTWWGSWIGLIVLSVLPLVLGAWMTVAAARMRRRRRRMPERDGRAAGNGWVPL